MFQQKYLIMETIGNHNQKSTSIVKDKHNHFFIAKKVQADDPKTIHEINLLKQLSHPNIIHLHEIIPHNHHAHIVEQYCEEGDLQYYLLRQFKLKKKVPEELVSRWMVQLLLAVQYLHHSKIIHRDIRPKNIFLTSSGNIKLGSFKASKQLEQETTYAQTLINSSYYMTPELLQGKKYDSKVDIWALGCVLYEMCTLKPLLNLLNLADMVGKATTSKMEELPPQYSKQLNAIYLKCMKRNPNERSSASELLKTNYFLSALEKFISDQGLNFTLQEKIPIKKYKIHRYKYERLKLKRGLAREKPVEKKDNLLPKLELFARDKTSARGSSRSKDREKEKDKIVRTPVLKGSSISKETVISSASTEKKKIKTEAQYSSKYKRQSSSREKATYKMPSKQPKGQSHHLATPPLLPKPVKKIEKEHQKNSSRASKTEEEVENFETTMSKESLSKQLANFQKKQLKQINEGLNKIFDNWNIASQDQIQFQFEEESELRLTAKASQEQSACLLKTVKSKLQQLIEEINYKYCPDMQRKWYITQLLLKKQYNSTPVAFPSYGTTSAFDFISKQVLYTNSTRRQPNCTFY